VSVWDGVTRAAGRPGASIRNFELQQEEKGRSHWVTRVFWCRQGKISIIIFIGPNQMRVWGRRCTCSFEKADI